MNKEKLIDVIIPAYKAQESIERTVASLAIQSIKDKIKVTIVNDCDSQDYSKVIKRYSDLIDIQEIKLNKNGGPGVARQYGIDNTNLPYFTCIDADDTLSGAFSLELLYKNLINNPNGVVCVGSFLEEHEDLQFIPHAGDLIWMFGKLYLRKFIDKYEIKFNETRANEDNGFNTLVRLCSDEYEKIIFIQDVVYYWHFKEDSITRINNCEYSYNQSFPGYTENMIYAVKEAKKKKPFNGYINLWATQVMFNLYVYWLQTCERDPRFKEQNFNSCVKFYEEVFRDINKELSDKIFKEVYSTVMRDSAQGMLGVAPHVTIYQFLEILEDEISNKNKEIKKDDKEKQ
jgi:glycosyltransferase involved in cell wall biosynthesis